MNTFAICLGKGKTTELIHLGPTPIGALNCVGCPTYMGTPKGVQFDSKMHGSSSLEALACSALK
jgi:hypothetical protein